MGGKSGGGYDAGPMLEYGNKALALQEQMYNDSVDRTQPFYEGGVGAFNVLMDMMGVNGGNVKTRDQIYNNLKDQYTTTTTSGGEGSMFVAPDGSVMDASDPQSVARYMQTLDPRQQGMRTSIGVMAGSGDYDGLAEYGFKAMNPTQTTSTIDYDGLNAAVDAQFGAQETPDNFGSLMESFSADKFEADPGYQFRLDEGQKVIERAAAARGQYYDPSTVKAMSEYNANMADQTYGDAYNRYNNDQTSIFNRLAAVSGIGQTANNSLNQTGQNYANQAGNIYGQMGSAQVEANAANAAAPSMFDQLLGAGVQLGTGYLTGGGSLFGGGAETWANGQAFRSDIRVKENIKHVGEKNGIPLIHFNYIGDDTTWEGVSAQDVELVNPKAVKEIDGIKHVNYSMIGIDMQEVK